MRVGGPRRCQSKFWGGSFRSGFLPPSSQAPFIAGVLHTGASVRTQTSSASSPRTGIVPVLAVVGMLAIPCRVRWRKTVLGEAAADSRGGGAARTVLLPTTAFDAWANVPDRTLSTHAPILIGQVGGQRVPSWSMNNAGASAKVGLLVSTETLFSSRKTT